MSKKSARGGQRAVLGLINHRKGKQPCGICGDKKQMTRSHVPPQCAGNESLVKRYRLMVGGNEVDAGRQSQGGIHLYGLCSDCNTAAGRFDRAYGHLADGVRQLWVKSWQIEVPQTIAMPQIAFDPGGVVRSILLGMCATGPFIRRHWPDLPPQLVSGTVLELPPELRLYLALARGMTARVAGPIAGFHVLGPHQRRGSTGAPLGITAAASVYFPPLAWELIHVGETVLTVDRWADVSSWTTIGPGETHLLSGLVPALPAVCHPWHHPTRSEYWVELFSTELTPIVECVNVEGGPPDPRGPLTLDKRAHVSVDDFRAIARRRGIDWSDSTAHGGGS
jgi:hypothetical protein